MNAVPFDTLEQANKLKAVGFTDEQAQAIIELQVAAIHYVLEQVRYERDGNHVETQSGRT